MISFAISYGTAVDPMWSICKASSSSVARKSLAMTSKSVLQLRWYSMIVMARDGMAVKPNEAAENFGGIVCRVNQHQSAPR
jgi:hypothetical protein